MIVIVISFVGCVSRPETTPPPIAQAPTPPPTQTLTATPTPFIPTNTPTATATPVIPTLIPTQTPLPTPTATQNPYPLGSVPLLAGTTYQLATPDPDILYNVLRLVTGESSYSCSAGELTPCYQKTIIADENRTLIALIGDNIRRYYPNGFPNPERVFVDPEITFSAIEIPFGGILELIQDSIERYFTSITEPFVPYQEQVVDDWSFILYPIEVDGDPGREWVAKITLPNMNLISFITLDETPANIHTIIPSQFPNYSWHFDSNNILLNTTNDLTGDGIADIILSSSAYVGGQLTIGAIEVFAWDRQKFRFMESISTTYTYSFLNEPSFSIEDYTGDGIKDIQVITPKQQRFDCYWQRTDIYSWANMHPYHQILNENQPDTPVCNLSEAIFSLQSLWNPYQPTSPITQATTLLHTLDQLNQEEEADTPQIVYTRLQLAFNYAMQGLDQTAQQILEGIYELPQNEGTVRFIELQYEASGREVLGLCRNLLTNQSQIINTQLNLYVQSSLIYWDPGYLVTPQRVCFLSRIAYLRATNAHLPASVSPTTALATEGLHLAYAQELNIDNDLEMEWLGILEPLDPSLVMFDLVSNEWQITFVDHLLYPISDMTFAHRNILDNSPTPELIVSVRYNYLNGVGNESNHFEVFLFERQATGYETIAAPTSDSYISPEQVRLSFFTLPDSPPPAWWFLDGFAEQDLLSYLGILMEQLLTMDDLETVRADLQALVDYLPADDPNAQLIINQLLFLIGYTYELNNDPPEAVQTYQQLIQQSPNSLWAWLAWARLADK